MRFTLYTTVMMPSSPLLVIPGKATANCVLLLLLVRAVILGRQNSSFSFAHQSSIAKAQASLVKGLVAAPLPQALMAASGSLLLRQSFEGALNRSLPNLRNAKGQRVTKTNSSVSPVRIIVGALVLVPRRRTMYCVDHACNPRRMYDKCISPN